MGRVIDKVGQRAGERLANAWRQSVPAWCQPTADVHVTFGHPRAEPGVEIRTKYG
jgi:hypothetical protein